MPLHIHNARLIDGTGEDRGDRPYALLIEGNRITAVAPQDELDCPDNVPSFDARGMTVMPGMIDCHDHQAAMEGTLRDKAAIPPSLVCTKNDEDPGADAAQRFHGDPRRRRAGPGD